MSNLDSPELEIIELKKPIPTKEGDANMIAVARMAGYTLFAVTQDKHRSGLFWVYGGGTHASQKIPFSSPEDGRLQPGFQPRVQLAGAHQDHWNNQWFGDLDGKGTDHPFEEYTHGGKDPYGKGRDMSACGAIRASVEHALNDPQSELSRAIDQKGLLIGSHPINGKSFLYQVEGGIVHAPSAQQPTDDRAALVSRGAPQRRL